MATNRTIRIDSHPLRQLGGMLALLFASTASASGDDAFLFEHDRVDPTRSQIYERVVLPLPNGNETRIAPTYDAKGRLLGAFVSEIVRRGNSSAIVNKALGGLNPRQVFHALAPEGTPEPRFLVGEFEPPDARDRQGWARALAVSDNRGHGARDDLDSGAGPAKHPAPCAEDAQSFDEMSEEVSLLNYQSTYVGERIGPSDHPQYWTSLPLYNLWELHGGVSYVKEFYSTVVFCYNGIDLSPWDEAAYDESIEYAYRVAGGGFVGTGKHLVNTGDKVSFLWTRALNAFGIHGFEVGPNEAPDFQLHIDNGTTYDLFHIGATWTEELPI